MRICVMNSLMWKMGGAENFCLETIKALAKIPKYQVFVLCEKMPARCMTKLDNVNVVETGFSGMASHHGLRAAKYWTLLPILAKKMAKILAKIKPDLLNPHNFPDVLYASYYKAHEKDVEVSWFCHEPFRLFYDTDVLNHKPKYEQLFFRLLRSFISPRDLKYVQLFVDDIGANSNYTANCIKKIYKKSSQVIYPGVDINRFRRVSSELRADENFMILSVGRIEFSYKNTAIIPVVLSRLKEKYNVKWVHVGTGTDELKLMDLIKRFKVQDSLKVISYVSERDLIKYYSAANLVIYPSIREPFGLVPLEAMACETPVIASKYGGTAETVVDKETGFLVDMESIPEVTEAASQMAENEDMTGKMGKLGRERVVRHFTLDRTARNFLTFVDHEARP